MPTLLPLHAGLMVLSIMMLNSGSVLQSVIKGFRLGNISGMLLSASMEKVCPATLKRYCCICTLLIIVGEFSKNIAKRQLWRSDVSVFAFYLYLRAVMSYSINVKGNLMTFDVPAVMGILNVTPDSFYASSRVEGDALLARAKDMLSAGAAILDLGACSTRPGSEPVSEKEELARLHAALDILDKELPQAVISVDTFRAAVVRECVKEHNVSIINDVSGYDWDSGMLDAVLEASLPYVLTHSVDVTSVECCTAQVLTSLSQKLWQLRQGGLCDVIIDPGFGFGKTLEQNFELFANLREFEMLDAPLLVGISRKSMITKTLDVKAAEALEGTVALNTMALDRGAHVLRVHDVKEAAQAVALWQAVNKMK